MKRRYGVLGLAAGLIVTGLFVWYVVRSLRGHDLSVYATPRAGLGIGLAALLWTCGAPLLALAWRGLLDGLGVHRSRRELFGIVGITQFAKYVPGNVAQYIGRVGMSLAHGIPARSLAVTLVLETLLVVAAAVVMGVGTGALSEVGLEAVRLHGAQLAVIAALIVLATTGLFIFRRIAPELLRRFAPRYAPALDGALLPPQVNIVRAFVLYCAMYAAMGVGLILLTHFLLPSAPHDYWLLIAVFALAWVVGFLTPGAPGGLGVREALMVLMLAPIYTAASASVLVIALRIASTLGDVLILMGGLLSLPKRSGLSSTTPAASCRATPAPAKICVPSNAHLTGPATPHAESMKIVLWGTYDTGKPRVRILRDGLRALNVEVIEIHKSIWEDIGDKSALRGLRKWLRRGLRLLMAYPPLIWRYMRAPAHELALVSYPGQLDVLILRPFAWMRRKPIAFDWFISAFDTVVKDRKLLRRENPLAWMLWAGEWLASRAGDLVFMDTATHARRMEALFRLAQDSIGHVYVGAEAGFFHPTATCADDASLHVLFYGQFIPLHGIGTIIEAARLLHDQPIQWTLIGSGQDAPRVRALLAEQPLPRLRWLDWVPYDDLVKWVARADVCLGIFGTSDKASSVIPNKVFQVVAAGRPVVTRDSPAIRELMADQPPCVRLVKAGDAQALASAIRDSIETSHTTLACHRALCGQIDSAAIAKQFLVMVEQRLPEGNWTNDH